MGCVISAEGIFPTEEKVEVIKKAPHSKNSTQLRAFLAMINCHGTFSRNLSPILRPLNPLLQKDQEFLWFPQCEEAFNETKEFLSSSQVLVHYNPSRPVIFESYASQYGIGLSYFTISPTETRDPFIAYASRSLISSEKNYSQIKKEGLSIIVGVTKSCLYLFGLNFTL